MNHQPFADWLKVVDRILSRMVGHTSDGLPDFEYWRAWDEGESAYSVARQAVQAAKHF